MTYDAEKQSLTIDRMDKFKVTQRYGESYTLGFTT